MLWSPNIGAGYPFGGGLVSLPTLANDPINFALLDTNNDGEINQLDDPYLPFYPGDDVVDWVGISVYNIFRNGGQTMPVANNVLTDPGSPETLFAAGNLSFYPRFVTQKSKPFILSETGSAVVANDPSPLVAPAVTVPFTAASEVAIKQSWWTGIFVSSVMAPANTLLSGLRGAVWFEEIKIETSYDNSRTVLRDYRATFAPLVAAALASDLSKLGSKVTAGGKFSFTCKGQILPK